MPIRIPNDLPARKALEREGVSVMTEATRSAAGHPPAAHRPAQSDAQQDQDRDAVRPTDRRDALAGRLDAGPHHQPHAQEHLARSHDLLLSKPGRTSRPRKFDGFIVTGAPVELLAFEDVTYWNELLASSTGRRRNVHSSMNICWGAQAALHHFHGVPKHALARKGLRRLPPPQSQSSFTLSPRLLG